MRSVIYSMNVSLDGYIAGPDDEFRATVHPVVVGGIPFYPQCERRLDLELIESRTFNSRVVYLRYRVAH
jgi:hypothetical protein